MAPCSDRVTHTGDDSMVLQSYNGGSKSGDTAGGYMNFLVDAPRSNLTVIKNDLLRIAAVTGARFGEQADYGSDW